LGVNSAFTLDTLGLPARDSRVPDPAGARSRALVLETMRRDVPGHPLDDRVNQAKHFDSLPYLCIEQIARGLAGSTLRITQKRTRAKAVSASTSASQYKALPTPHSQAEDQEYIPVDDGHPLCRLFEHVNEVDTLEDWLSDWVVNEELHGEAVLWPVPDEDGFPAELWCVPTAACVPLLPGVGPQYPCGALRVVNWMWGLAGAFGAGAGQMVTLDNRNILRPRRRHPLYRFAGYSPLTAGAKEIDQYNAISEGRKKHMDAGFAPDVVISVPGATRDQLDRLRAEWEGRLFGSKGQRVLFTDGESIKADRLQQGAREMDYPSGWEQMTKFVCALWQTSAGILGLTEADSYAAFYARLKQHHTLGLGPKARRMGAFLTKHLANRYWPDDRLKVEFDLPAIDDQDVQDRQLQNDGQLGVRTVNEIRGSRNLPPLEGADVPPAVWVQMQTGRVQQDQQRAGIAAGLLPDPTKQPEPQPVQTPPGPPRPDNADGEGSLPPKMLAKSARRYANRVIKSLGK
jgi:phage portal protein BeeE